MAKETFHWIAENPIRILTEREAVAYRYIETIPDPRYYMAKSFDNQRALFELRSKLSKLWSIPWQTIFINLTRLSPPKVLGCDSCPVCDRRLNDGGTCPVCDDGEEDM